MINQETTKQPYVGQSALTGWLGGRHPMATERPKLNGVDCPNCRAELFDTMPNQLLLSSPPQKNVHCESCGYKGYRVA